MTGSETRPPGRPRSEASRLAILAAARHLLETEGYAAITVDGIAAQARVGRQTLYRRWPTKADAVLELVADRPDFAVPVADHGDYRSDLRAFLRTAFALASEAPTAELLRGLMTEAQLRPEFGERFRRTFLEPRRAAFAEITRRAEARGDLPAHPPAEVVADVAFGVLWYRLLATRGALDDALADELVRLLAP